MTDFNSFHAGYRTAIDDIFDVMNDLKFLLDAWPNSEIIAFNDLRQRLLWMHNCIERIRVATNGD